MLPHPCPLLLNIKFFTWFNIPFESDIVAPMAPTGPGCICAYLDSYPPIYNKLIIIL